MGMGSSLAMVSVRFLLCVTLAASLFATVAAKSASASHILVKDEAKILEIKAEIEGGAEFGEMAKKHSTCPSGKSGGSLGSFGPGQMVPECDKVVFSGNVKEVLGPVKTQFGHHLIWISERTD